jgi:hypothetical protein
VTLKRYELVHLENDDSFMCDYTDNSGDWVKWQDVSAEIERFREMLRDMYHSPDYWREIIRQEFGVDEGRGERVPRPRNCNCELCVADSSPVPQKDNT